MNRLSIGTWLLATAIAGGSPAQAEVASGERVFETRCTTCHALDEHRWGPALRGVVGRPVASEPGYRYSSALRSVQFRWTAELLDRWLQNPSALVPGTRMSAHFSSAADRDAIIAYLTSPDGANH
jgi:cytochrome c